MVQDQLDSALEDFLSFIAPESIPARNHLAWAHELEQQVKDLTLSYIGEDTGVRAEGVYKGYPLLLTIEEGLATVKLGDDPLNIPLYQAQQYFPHTTLLTSETFREILLTLLGALEVAPYKWSFRGRALAMTSLEGKGVALEPGDSLIYHSWGTSAQAAYAQLVELDEGLLKSGVDLDTQRKIVALQNICSTPLAEDPRVFPEVPPTLEIIEPCSVR